MDDRKATEENRQPVSKLVISDRLIALALEAERAGLTSTAHHLVNLACYVFDDMPQLH